MAKSNQEKKKSRIKLEDLPYDKNKFIIKPQELRQCNIFMTTDNRPMGQKKRV